MGFGSQSEHEHARNLPAAPAGPSSEMARRPVILVINKSDCRQFLKIAQLKQMWPGAPLIHTSMLTGAGIAELEEQIAQLMLTERNIHTEWDWLSRARPSPR